jgi:ribosome biogenesis GTPase / thiamine phosphate phosphatase
MRELLPWTSTSAVDGAFDDVASLALNCRFGDCAHDGEPGCAVTAAVEAGGLDADRVVSYHRLVRELAFEERKRDKAAAADAKRKLKAMMKAAKALYRDRERS